MQRFYIYKYILVAPYKVGPQLIFLLEKVIIKKRKSVEKNIEKKMVDEYKNKKTNDKAEDDFSDGKLFIEDRTKTKTILAIDLATTTGWAIKNAEGKITSGLVTFKQNRFAGGGIRYLQFQRWLEDLPKMDIVFFEEVRRHLGVDAAHAYGGFLSHLTAWCEMHQIPYQGIPVGSIKRFITGKGNASKAEVIGAVKALGHEPTDDNEADALALLHLAMQKVSSAKKSHQEVKYDN